ncbi:uncharacterized protein ARMOST_08411 [Armillaria ostoyae]|uniref:Uncharacterized protein n=1 Tax=Armillaria ostoyae TaxID=47428 RepID=A0A284R8K7_ARMOS|nr:uncharacterized protein ARMOST_08411 [Armillaria ostoyae]
MLKFSLFCVSPPILITIYRWRYRNCQITVVTLLLPHSVHSAICGELHISAFALESFKSNHQMFRSCFLTGYRFAFACDAKVQIDSESTSSNSAARSCDSGICTATAEGVKLIDKNALEEKSANTPYSHIMPCVLSTLE